MAGSVEKCFGRRTAAPIPRLRAASPGRSAPGTSALREANRLAGLDLLRLFAALCVVLFHFGYAGPARGTMQTSFPLLAGPAQYGFLGVDLFFLISGFVIAASVHGRTWRQFALSRAIRLYPGYVACMTTTALALLLLAQGSQPVSAQLWLANLTMVAPAFGLPFMDGAYWSIVIEIVFYGWVAILVAAGIFERRLMTILAFWLAIAFFNEAFLQSRAIRLGLCTEYAALFASGILFQRILTGERRAIAWLLLGFAFGLGAMHAFENERIFARLYQDTISLPALAVLHVGIYALFLAGVTASRWIPASRAVLAAGALTYPLYLVHQQTGYLLIDTLAPATGAAAALVLSLAILVAFAYAVSAWLEPAARRFLRLVFGRLVTADRPTAPRFAHSH
jgi:peptidoglycan/LPS O-acetylase OafA/YrhL